MAVGGFDMHFVTTIININFENVARWAEKNRIAFTTFVDLSQKPEVYDLIQKEVERVNETLPPPARVQKFVILHKAFDADEAELTRTRKLRRRRIGTEIRADAGCDVRRFGQGRGERRGEIPRRADGHGGNGCTGVCIVGGKVQSAEQEIKD